jgi:hypothetical protein
MRGQFGADAAAPCRGRGEGRRAPNLRSIWLLHGVRGPEESVDRTEQSRALFGGKPRPRPRPRRNAADVGSQRLLAVRTSRMRRRGVLGVAGLCSAVQVGKDGRGFGINMYCLLPPKRNYGYFGTVSDLIKNRNVLVSFET